MNSSDVRLVRLIPTTGEGSFTGGGGSYWDSAGALQQAPPNTLRMTYDPADLSKAPYALVEPEATNFIRNNSMQGAALGTPGTPPTGWSIMGINSGINRSITGIGQEDGIDYIDVRFSGVSTAAFTTYHSISGTIPAEIGQVWATSAYFRLIAGAVDGLTLINRVSPRTNVGTSLPGAATTNFVPTAAKLSTQRVSAILTVPNDSAVANVLNEWIISFPNGANVDFTIRIGLPQLERYLVSSPIKTSGTAVTRAADVVGPGAGLVYSNVPITEPLWVAGTYAEKARVRDAQNFVFESLVAGNTAALTDKTKWLPLGITNRWKVFDKAVNSQSSAPGTLTFAVKPGVVATTMMLLNMEGASVTVSQSDSGYIQTKSLVRHEVDNWFDFYYEEPTREGDAVFTDLPPYPNSMLTVSIDNGPLDAKIGACLIGKSLVLGKVTASFNAGVLSYSTSTTDTFGNITMVKRYNAPRMNFDVMIPAGFEDRAYRVLRDYTDVELGIIVGDRFLMGIGYGFLGQWNVPKSGNGRTASIEFKGLV